MSTLQILPPEVTDEDVEREISRALASGEWKEKKDGDKTYYYNKSKKSIYRKELVKVTRAKLEEEGTEARHKEVAKLVKSALKEGEWKKATKDDKTYYYNPKNKKEVVKDLDVHFARQLGYMEEKKGEKGKGKGKEKDKEKEKETEKDKDKEKDKE
eukprot:Sspe_Gene.103800::Locus_79651_Transcript_1_1_Confidence_1.000_Length_505::g.103800::m.103800